MHRMIKRAAALVAGLALAASTVVAAELPAAAATECSTSFSTYPSIRKGSTGAKAKAMECLLAKAGFTTTVNGKFSAADATALAKFRKSIGLSPLKVGGRKAWTALLSQGATTTLKPGAKSADVTRLQYALRAAGYHKVPTSGSLDKATVTIVKIAQKRRGLKQTGVVNSAFWKALQRGRITAAAVKKAPAVKKPVKKKSAKKSASKSKGERALAFARKQLGDRYRYGGTGPNAWDCSGLTGGAWKSVGVKLPRTSQSQYRVGKKVTKSNLRKGDLVFFYSGISHVAIYAGSGKVIHASRPGKPVEYIKMKYMPYAGARRPG